MQNKYSPDMDATASVSWLQEKITWLQSKQRRELDYLNQRASRPGHLPTRTDREYRADQPHMADLLAYLKDLLDSCQQELSDGASS